MEGAEQKEFVTWFGAEYPAHIKSLRISMSGIKRVGRRAGAMMWNQMKSQGVQKGEADIAILLPKGGYGSLLVEHKGEGMARKLTEDQADYLGYHNLIGNRAESTRGLDELKQVVRDYMGL